MKTVFTNSEVAHIWMSESQSEGRTSRGNFYFDGPTIYSYGGHFPIARIVRNTAGVKAILLTTRGYSVTTSGHIHLVRRALDSSPVFNTYDPGRSNSGVATSYHDAIASLVDSIKPRMRANTKLAIFGKIQRTIAEANAFNEWVGSPERIETPESLESVVGNLESARKLAAERLAAENKKREIKAKRDAGIYRRAHAEDLERWRETGDWRVMIGERWNTLNFSAWTSDLLRFNPNSNEIETSRGATVPLKHAERAFKFVRAIKAAGKTWQTNGHTFHIGPYKLNSIDAKGNIRAGCHTIEWSEILALAVRLDWVNTSGPSTTTNEEVTA